MDTDTRLKKLIEILSSTNNYVPGSKLASILGLSKPMVHRLIEDLRKRGFVVESHPRRGYKFLAADDLQLAGNYVRNIGRRLKFKVYYVESCESTQDLAEALAKQGVSEGTIVLAEEMNKGRGRMNRQWIAEKGGLWFTLILRPRNPRGLQLLSLIAGLAVVRGIESLLGVKAKLKWPNDVLYDERKLAGILVEGRVEADIVKYILLGIGLNVNNKLPAELKDTAITLKEITGKFIPRIPVLRSILLWIDKYYDMFTRRLYDRILEEWKRYSTTIGRKVRAYTIGGDVVEGIAEDIANDGSLIIRLENGRKTTVYAGDIIHLR